MTRQPVGLHGPIHAPRGQDPSLTDEWTYVADSADTAWDSSTSYDFGDAVSDGFWNYQCVRANTNKEPSVDVNWMLYWLLVAPFFRNSWVNQGGGKALMAYKLVVGPPFPGRDIDTGLASLELQGSVTGGADATAIFTLPDGWRPSATKYRPACDDVGAFVVFTVQANGDVIHGFV